MSKTNAIVTLCKEYQREPTRRSWLAVNKALIALGLSDEDQIEIETRMGFRQNNGEFYPDILPQLRKPKAKKFDWSNMRNTKPNA